MPLFRVQVALSDVSNLPRDQYVNTMWLTKPTAPDWDEVAVDSDLNTLVQPLVNFYQQMSPYLSTAVKTGGLHTIKVYDHAAPLKSPPVAQSFIPLNTVGTSAYQSFPNEVACCLTYHAEPRPGPGWFPQSWRGRFYFGPLSASAAGPAQQAGNGRPFPAFMTTLATNGRTLEQAWHDAGWQWVVFTRTHNMVLPIANFGVDDAWDTQRTRGLRRTTVQTFAVEHAVAAAGPA